MKNQIKWTCNKDGNAKYWLEGSLAGFDAMEDEAKCAILLLCFKEFSYREGKATKKFDGQTIGFAEIAKFLAESATQDGEVSKADKEAANKWFAPILAAHEKAAGAIPSDLDKMPGDDVASKAQALRDARAGWQAGLNQLAMTALLPRFQAMQAQASSKGFGDAAERFPLPADADNALEKAAELESRIRALKRAISAKLTADVGA